jgi:hypothetical protein
MENILKCTWEFKEPRIAKTIFKNEFGRCMLPSIKLYYAAEVKLYGIGTIRQAVWWGQH